MPIKLDWDGGSVDIDGYRVYRSEKPMDPLNLPVAIATLGKSIKTWTDNDTPRGKLYYYRISGYKGEDIAVTFERAISYTPYTGPGPSELVCGDWEAGFFGEMLFNDFLSMPTFSAFTAARGCTIAGSSVALRWLKMAYKGSVLFIPDGSIGTLTWNMVYAAGLVYGSLNTDLIPPIIKSSKGIINQNTKITIGEDEFIVRLPRSKSDPLEPLISSPQFGGHEFDLVYAKLFVDRNRNEWGSAKGFRSYRPLNGVYVLTSDLGNANATQSLVRGGSADSFVDSVSSSSMAGSSSYIPVLELVL